MGNKFMNGVRLLHHIIRNNYRGKRSGLAKDLNISSQAIANWMSRGEIPPGAALDIEKLLSSPGIGLRLVSDDVYVARI